MRFSHVFLIACAIFPLIACPQDTVPQSEGDEVPNGGGGGSGISGIVRDDDTGMPIQDALVTVQATSTQTSTASDGSFTLGLASGNGLKVVGAREGYYSSSVTEDAPATNIEILLTPVILGANASYSFVAPATCAGCHPNQDQEWTDSAMANAALNTWVHDMYDGNGTPGGSAGFVYTDDSTYSGANYDSECAACHQPEAWITAGYSGPIDDPGDAGYPSPSARHGVSCDICHKIAYVDTARINYPGIFPGAVDFNLPADGIQVQYGSLPDADHTSSGVMQPSYQPQLVAEACGVCHQNKNDHPDMDETFDGQPAGSTYAEWEQSPYGNPSSSLFQTCADCHMPPSGQTELCSTDPVTRDADTVRTHAIQGTTAVYLDNAVELSMQTTLVGSELQVDVDIYNSLTGHHVPTGATARNMILLVEAWEDGDDPLVDPLVYTGSQFIDDLGGSAGNPEDGYFAGLPGKLYARVNDDKDGYGPTLFTDATAITFDTRIAAFATDTTNYTFDVPSVREEIHVRARLIYRRAFRSLVDTKGWTEDGHGNPLEDLASPHYGHLMEIATDDVPGTGPVQYDLSVTAGTGGTVTSSPAGINCPGTCSASFDDGESIVLTATPDGSNTFAGWTGDDCTAQGATCNLTLNSDISVTADFDLPQFDVAVVAASGGSVTSSPAGINCPGTCSAAFDTGTNLTLTASAESTHDFDSWTGAACAAQGAACTFALSENTLVFANFLERFDASVTVLGLSGQAGAVTSSSGAISCPTACSASFANGESVDLIIAAPVGFTFSGWSGACSGTGSCQLTMSQDRSVTATFNASGSTFNLNVTNSGNGAVHAADGGIDCGGDCSQTYDENTSVSLIAIPDAGFEFDGWDGGPCNGTGGTCNLVMTSDVAVSAAFSAAGSATCANGVVTYDSGGTNGYGLQRVLEREAGGSSIEFPTSIAFLPGSSLRFVVTEQGSGKVHYYDGGCAAKNTVDLDDDLGVPMGYGGEQGLLDVKLHPDFESNGYLFFYHTSAGNQMNSVTRATFSLAPSGQMVLADAQHIIGMAKGVTASNHNGGQVVFAPDGTLLAAVGDGGGSTSTARLRAQDHDRLVGKILRVSPSLAAGVGGYTIPSGNMFDSGNDSCDEIAQSSEDCPEILAKGLRNPFRMSIDGDVVYIGNVGSTYEELESFAYTNNAADFGWGRTGSAGNNDGPDGEQGNRDALIAYSRTNPPATTYRLQDPVCGGCSNAAASIVIGGVYRGSRYGGQLTGSIFHGAYYDGYIRAEPVNSTGDGSLVGTPTSGMHVVHEAGVTEMVEGSDGFVYIVGHGSSVIYRLVKP